MRKLKALIKLLIHISLAPIIIFVLLFASIIFLIIASLGWLYDQPIDCFEDFTAGYFFLLHDPIAKHISELINE